MSDLQHGNTSVMLPENLCGNLPRMLKRTVIQAVYRQTTLTRSRIFVRIKCPAIEFALLDRSGFQKSDDAFLCLIFNRNLTKFIVKVVGFFGFDVHYKLSL